MYFDWANVSEFRKYDLLTFCKIIFGGPTGGPNGGLRSQLSALSSQVSGLRSQVSGLRSRVSGLGSQVSVLRSQVSDLRSQVSGLGSIVSILFFLFTVPISIGFPFKTLHLINVSSTYTYGSFSFVYRPER